MEIEENQRIDILPNGYKIIQDTERFMYGIDAVLLASFALEGIKQNDKLIDLGTGTGIIPLLLEKVSCASLIYGLEIQKDSFEMAKKTMEINGLNNKISIIQGDIKKVSQISSLSKHQFNVVTVNPPYMTCEDGKFSPNDAKAIARHEVLCNLEDVIKAADYLLSSHGKFFMIHRAYRLAEILYLLKKYNLEPKTLKLIQPSIEKEANLVLVEARKNAKSQLNIKQNLIVYKEKGVYSDEVKSFYKSVGL